jgi:hypothetical protein
MGSQYIKSGTTQESSDYCRGPATPGALAASEWQLVRCFRPELNKQSWRIALRAVFADRKILGELSANKKLGIDSFRIARDTPKIALPVRVLSVIAVLNN